MKEFWYTVRFVVVLVVLVYAVRGCVRAGERSDAEFYARQASKCK